MADNQGGDPFMRWTAGSGSGPGPSNLPGRTDADYENMVEDLMGDSVHLPPQFPSGYPPHPQVGYPPHPQAGYPLHPQAGYQSYPPYPQASYQSYPPYHLHPQTGYQSYPQHPQAGYPLHPQEVPAQQHPEPTVEAPAPRAFDPYYKKKKCRYFNEGKGFCRDGANCTYCHTHKEWRNVFN